MNNSEKAREVELKWKAKFLFAGLRNLNDGFDAPSVHYFSAADFQIVLDRVEALGVGIYGIEPWLEKQYYDTAVAENYGLSPFDPAWYRSAFASFCRTRKDLMYAASFAIPENVISGQPL